MLQALFGFFAVTVSHVSAALTGARTEPATSFGRLAFSFLSSEIVRGPNLKEEHDSIKSSIRGVGDQIVRVPDRFYTVLRLPASAGGAAMAEQHHVRVHLDREKIRCSSCWAKIHYEKDALRKID